MLEILRKLSVVARLPDGLRRDFRARISEVSVVEEVMCGLSGAIDLRTNRVDVVRYFVHMGLVDAEFPELVETPDELVVA
jgi:hypothetical protein